ncbi:MAG: DUF2203 domain-containing protein [bacterium]
MAIFTLEEARATLPEVREITEHYYNQIVELKEQFNKTESEQRKKDLIQEINYVFSSWADEIHTLGAQVKGPWLVDFDSGDGIFYCWKYGEDDIQFFHRYETGFEGRRPLDKLKQNP